MFDLDSPIEFSAIKDDLINRRLGFFFVIYLSNNLAMAYLELLERVCAIRRSGLYNPGTKELNPRGVFLYLRKEEQFRELLMALLYMTGG